MSVACFLVSQLLFAGVELEVQAGGDTTPGKRRLVAGGGTSIETVFYVALSRLKARGVKFGFNLK